mgnify:CR=1 FL=1
MNTKSEQILVSSHVSRDFLQNSAYFNTFPKIVWEYVSNSLDAAEEGVPVNVAVEVSSRWIKVSDDGKGMSREELRNFFQMHGENVHRRRGKRVRGRFGTGKSAAFGLANRLRIDTTQDGFRNVVELHREDIERASDGRAFSVREIVVNRDTDEANGTVIEIRDLNTKRPNVDEIVSYLERHLGRYRQRAFVAVNGHECQFEEPQSVSVYRVTPPPEVAQHIGDVTLIIKVSPVPLEEDNNGIDILSYGIWHGTTLAGVEKRERANYIFGEIDVPILEDEDWVIPAFDNTRNNTLNPQNPVVVVLLGWIAEEIEATRQRLVDEERERRKSEQARQLAEEARKIAEILNDDFAELEIELEFAREVARRAGRKPVDESPDEQGLPYPGDGSGQSPWQESGQPHGQGQRGENPPGPGDEPRPGPSITPGGAPASRQSVERGTRKRRQAIFSIDYANETAGAARSRYDPVSKTIWINLDHPQIASALRSGGGRVESRQFREMCYEVAVVEYALAVPYERIERDEILAPEDALYDVRDTINRVTRRFVEILQD